MAYSGYVREGKLKKLPMLHVGEAVVFVMADTETFAAAGQQKSLAHH